jgi:hypothetical protein
MKIGKDTPRENVGIQGVVLTIAQPFTEGHTCTGNEAAALNQLLKENVRNNQAPAVKKADDEKVPKTKIQADLDTYVNGYEFGIRRAGSTLDPIEREALSLAKEKVREAMARKGLKLSEVKAADITAKAQATVEKYPQFREKAKQIVASRKMDISDLDI